MDSKLRGAVVGCTGVVGREIVAALADGGHPADRVTVFASESTSTIRTPPTSITTRCSRT